MPTKRKCKRRVRINPDGSYNEKNLKHNRNVKKKCIIIIHL